MEQYQKKGKQWENTGKKVSEEAKAKWRETWAKKKVEREANGEDHWLKGKKRSEKHIQKCRETRKKNREAGIKTKYGEHIKGKNNQLNISRRE